jgi:hypothetical protein
MPKPCSVCVDSRCPDIDESLRSGIARAKIAEEFGFPKNRIDSHAQHYRKNEQPSALPGSDVAQRKANLDAAAEKARKKGDLRGEVLAIREWRSLDEHERRLEQATPEGSALTTHPAWDAFAAKLLEAIGDCESCRAALLACAPGGTRAE